MEQLTQKLKNGDTRVQEVPLPQLGDGMVLVRNHFSVISAGTEGATASSARKGLLAKAKERPQQVRQVFDVLRKSGPVQTYRAVTKKLEAYSPCGYSSAGEVIAVGARVTGFAAGDLVACAGVGYANHAEVVAVPVNLCVKLSPGADLEAAAYNTVGAIAMQGVRQAGLVLGESALVIGLGLIGRLTAQLLKAAGVRVIGVDVNAAAVAAAAADLDLGLVRGDVGIADRIAEFSGGYGVDAVIIAAGTSSLDPINFAGASARRKGTVVVVGAAPTGFDRKDYYRKELQLRMSCSYGPGRYDAQYEEKGEDYPYEYVRWTEKRNMESFQQLIQAGRICPKNLTSHRFKFEDAPRAYALIVEKTEPFVGIVLEYDVAKPVASGAVETKAIAGLPEDKVRLAFIGAGSYAQGNLLPNLPDDVARLVVLTNSGTTSKRVAERFGFARSTGDEKDIFGNGSINTVFVATRHDSHAGYVLEALRNDKNVFVEKPLAMTVGEMQAIEEARQTSGKTVMVGFNRRFSPLSVKLKKAMGSGPMAMFYRVNAGKIPADSWIQDMEVGGGRIIGEGCHFIDYMTWMCGAKPVKVYASAMPDPQQLNDTVNVNIEFADGSIGVLAYYANGSKSQPKEYFEVHGAGASGVLHDFRSVEVFGRRPEKMKLWSQDKGQKAMVAAFCEAVKTGGEPIPFDQLKAATLTAIAVMESLREKAPIAILE
ncbi:MAG: bi-domain-containing oxidoreductase [Victivallaceae bacterium]|nr:bi-domain-containing oxidoreductase [Victivallaceae bacterium]